MMTTPPKEVSALRAWVERNGGQVLAPTNAYEVLRFKTDRGTGIVYRRGNGALTYSDEAKRCARELGAGHNIRLTPAQPRRKRSHQIVAVLLEKQGGRCFFCHREVDGTATIEHLVPVTAGGPSHIANYVLAHRECNRRAGHLSALDKVLMRERLREEAQTA